MPSRHRRPRLKAPRAPPGTCRGCGKPILAGQRRNPGRSTWHLVCAARQRLAGQGDTRAAVFRRDAGVCATCGTVCGEDVPWHADHILALALAGRDPAAFTLANLQTLCVPCHIIKTRQDAARIRANRQPVRSASSPDQT